jgi:hypothetical protein
LLNSRVLRNFYTTTLVENFDYGNQYIPVLYADLTFPAFPIANRRAANSPVPHLMTYQRTQASLRKGPFVAVRVVSYFSKGTEDFTERSHRGKFLDSSIS